MEQEKIEKILNNIERDFKINKDYLIRPKTEEEAIELYNEIKGIGVSKPYYGYADFLNDLYVDYGDEELEVYTKNQLKNIWWMHKEEYIKFCQKNDLAFENYGI